MNNSMSMLKKLESHRPDDIALSDGSELELSYRQLLSITNKTAHYFCKNELNGIATLMDNSPASVIISLALLESACWSVPIPPFFTPKQRDNALRQSGCNTILSDKKLSDFRLINTIYITGLPVYLYSLPTAYRDQTCDGTSLVTFTSGSTAEPKGLCLSNDQIVSTATAIAEAMMPFEIKTHLSILPTAVLLEQIAGVYACLIAGAKCVIPSSRKTGLNDGRHVDFERLLSCLLREKVNSCILVPELIKGLYLTKLQTALDLPTLKFIAVGGARSDPGLLCAATHSGLPVYEGYGLSEAGSVATLNLPGANKQGSVGRPLSNQRLSINSAGEVVLGSASFLGYCGKSTLPVSPFNTGDLGYFDEDGFLHINGRKKNVLITSMGRNVSPEWIESVLTSTIHVQQAFVFGDGQTKLSALLVSSLSKEKLTPIIDQINGQLPDYANIGDWKIIAPFTVESGTLTGSGKLRREAIYKTYCAVA